MRASFFSVGVVMVGVAAASAGCSQADAPVASDGSEVVAEEVPGERVEYECTLDGGRLVRILPAFSEIHRIDLNAGTWEMQDGLSIERSPFVLTVRDDEGGAVATIDKHGQYYAEEDGVPVYGPCSTSQVRPRAPTSTAFEIDERLEYACTATDGAALVVRPEFGEIDEIHPDKGTFSSHDGIRFDLKSLETAPPQNQLRGVDEEGTEVASLLESDGGVTFTMGALTGSCEKLQRIR